MHTPTKFYLKIPTDLYRGGAAKKPKFDYIRTSPPRDEDDRFDIKIDPDTKKIDHLSGGLSLFNRPNFEHGTNWWVIPAGIDLPPGFTVTKDLTDGKFKGHYSIRALSDIDINDWKKILKEWAEENAVHISEYLNKDVI